MAQPDAVRNEFQEEEEEEVCDVEACVRSIIQRRRDGGFPEFLHVDSCIAAKGFTPAGNRGEGARGCRMQLCKDKEFEVCVMDESHQWDFFLVAPMANVVRPLFLLWDPAQRIEFVRQDNEPRHNAIF